MATAADRGSDLSQVSQRLTWLDEERRRDRAELARLAQEASQSVLVLRDQAAKLREMMDRINSLETSLARVTRVEDSVTLARSELVQAREFNVRTQDEIRREAKERQTQAEQSARTWAEISARLEAFNRSGDDLAARLHVVETRERDTAGRVAQAANQLFRLEAANSEAAEEPKRIMARLDGLVSELAQLRKTLATAQEESSKMHVEQTANLSEDKEALALLQRRVADHIDGAAVIEARVERMEDNYYTATQLHARLDSLESQLNVLQNAAQGFQATEDERWGKQMPELLQLVEEAAETSRQNAVTLQDVLGALQAQKEELRALDVDLGKERLYNEELAGGLRRLIEEDNQTRLLDAQRMVQGLRKLAQVQEARMGKEPQEPVDGQ